MPWLWFSHALEFVCFVEVACHGSISLYFHGDLELVGLGVERLSNGLAVQKHVKLEVLGAAACGAYIVSADTGSVV